MNTLTLIGKRLAYAIGLIFAVLTINFALIHAAPGDPAMVIAGEMGGADQATLDQIRRTYGLDKPLLEQYTTYIVRGVQGDLGQSYLYNQPVVTLIMQRLPATVLLVLTALLTAIAVGTLVGVWASRRPHSIGSGAVTVLSLVGYAMPTFWTGILLVILFGVLVTLANNWISFATHNYQSELYPTRVRARAIGFVYSWSRLSAALAGLLIGFFLRQGGTIGVALFIGGAMVVMVVTIAGFGPATSGRSLEEISR